MVSKSQKIKASSRKEGAASLVEYVLLIAFIVLVAIFAMEQFGFSLRDKYSEINSELPF